MIEVVDRFLNEAEKQGALSKNLFVQFDNRFRERTKIDTFHLFLNLWSLTTSSVRYL